MADIIRLIGHQPKRLTTVSKILTTSATFRRSEIESLAVLATKFGFLKDKEGILSSTIEGRSFERYLADLDSRVNTWRAPPLEQAVETQVCATFPPSWASDFSTMFGANLQNTMTGIKMILKDAKSQVSVVSPFLDVKVLQLCLTDVYAKETEFILVTSEGRLLREYQSGHNYEREKLSKLIGSRFKKGKVFHFESGQSIAHSKIWHSERSVFITSANVMSDSLTDNFEVGLYTDEPEVVLTIRNILEKVVRMAELVCILEVP